MVNLLHVFCRTKKHVEDHNTFPFEKDIEFLLFSFELYLLEVVLLLSYIEFHLIENLYELVFFELNLSSYLLNHFGLDVSFFWLRDI